MRRSVLPLMFMVLAATTASAGLNEEHMPVFCSSPTVKTVANGAWDNSRIWSTGRAPQAGDAVVVAHDVSYADVSDAVLTCLRVAPGAALRFATTSNTRLTVGTLQVFGTLEVGTETRPVAAGVTAEIVIADQPLDLDADPAQTGTGLLIVEKGVLRMHGSPVATVFTRLTREPRAGDTTLQVASASGWQVGDELIVPDTRQLRRADRGIPATAGPESAAQKRGQVVAPHTEYVRIAAVNGNIVSLDAPLQHDHPGARNPDRVLERLPMVGYLSRNVVVRSADRSGTRGHGLFNERANIDVRYTLWRGLGRTRVDPIDSTTFDKDGHPTKIGTNQIGRYPVHFHRVRGPWPANPDYQFKFVGNAVRDCLRWCAAIHDTHYGLFKGNVLAGDGVGGTGTGLVWEQGNEWKNVVEDIFIADVYGVARGVETRGKFLRDFGREGHGMWSNASSSEFKNVYVFGVGSAGFFWNRNLSAVIPAYPGSDMKSKGSTIKRSRNVPVSRTENLEVGGAVVGFEPWQWFFGRMDNVVHRYSLWHTAWQAVRPVYIGALPDAGLSFQDLWIRGDVTALQDPKEWPVGVAGNIQYYTRGVFNGLDIQGMRVGFRPAKFAVGSDIRLRNYINVELIFNRLATGGRLRGGEETGLRSYEYRRFDRVQAASLGVAVPTTNPPPVHVNFPFTASLTAQTGSTWSLEPAFNVFRDSCFGGGCHAELRGWFTAQNPETKWRLADDLTNAQAFERSGVSVYLEQTPCAQSVASTAGGRLCPGIPPVSGGGFKISQNSVDSLSGPTGDYTLKYHVCVETFEGECNGIEGPSPSRQWRVVEPSSIMLAPGKNWLARQVDLGNGRKVLHTFYVRFTEKLPPPPPEDEEEPFVELATIDGPVKGTVNIMASITDDVGVARAELYVDGTLVASTVASPYTFAWNTLTVANGEHDVEVRAYDAAGNEGSDAIVVVVKNGA